MMPKYSWILLLVIGVNPVRAQYFQQDVQYQIRVSLDDENHILRGEEEVVYTNNSPDTLTELWFHLWPNAYQNKKTALAKQLIRMGETTLYFSTEEDRGFIDSLAFTLNGKPCVWEYDEEHIDICRLLLESPLKPGDAVTIHTPFKVKIPNANISRLGHIGQSYQVTQWYPKPAVYDEDGWHAMPYLTQGEFYSEFGSFDVFITLPENYVVGATGDLQQKEEQEWLLEQVELTEAWLKQRDKNDDWGEWVDSMSFPASSKETKTLHFHQEQVHDFAWFADKRYHVLKGEVALPHSGDSMEVWTMFTNKNARLWSESIEYMHDAVHYYSLWNGDYPYQHATAVDGTIAAGGGMEYPNVTVIGDATDALTLETVIMHEVGHNWFYGILGSNERTSPWLDEGINSYNEQRYLSTKYPYGSFMSKMGSNAMFEFVGLDHYGIEDLHDLSYLATARANIDQPMDLHSDDYSLWNYGTIVYSKSAVTLNYLRHYLGDSLMDASMQRYFEDFKFKHPDEEDFRSTLERTSEMDLSWFFDDVVSTNKKLDYKLKSVSHTHNQTSITIKNRGIAGPVAVGAVDEKGEVTAQWWIEPFERDTTILVVGNHDRLVVDPEGVIPEVNRDNNRIDKTRVFGKLEPVKMKFLGGVERPEVNQVYWAPILGANVPNGFMPGLLLYNHIIPSKKFTYALAPMMATKGVAPVGTGQLSYSFLPLNGLMEAIELSFSGKRYHYSRFQEEVYNYARLEPMATFYIRPKKHSSMLRQQFSIGSVLLHRDAAVFEPDTGYVKTALTDVFNRVHYQLTIDHPVFPLKGDLRIEEHTSFVRTSIEVNQGVNFLDKFNLDIRLFGGTFLANNTTDFRYNWRMDGQSAANGTDYAFDGEFFDRSAADDFLNRQFIATHGGFKIPTANGQSSRWLAAANFKFGRKGFPIGLYADVGTSSRELFMANAGVYGILVKDLVEVYVPLIYTSQISRELDANGLKWHDLIRFNVNIHELNLIETVKRLRIL